ncbi:hypothetical protein JTB14_026318 [Gonioctena quinquepunctata]|nr:hypothetical protein JTB14_026318 [Gonioctena quinquepunctata]
MGRDFQRSKHFRGSQNVQLAVLHPKFLSVFNFKVKEGVAEHGTQHILERVYDHQVRTSASITIGPFGGTQNRDFICVQSLDGMLSFFEQENFNFSCYLPDCLLPSPISYVTRTDSFVTGDANWQISAYKYNYLSENGQKSVKNAGDTTKLTYDWCYNLGETIIDISVIEDAVNKQSSIMILGEKNLFCLNDRGRIKFMKRLEYSPICFDIYLVGDNILSLVVSETNTLLIYQNTTLKWSSKLHFLPICIRRAFFQNIQGALVLLSEEGKVECAYLGMEPSLFVSPPLTTKEIDFEKVEEELVGMNEIIKNSYGNDIKLTNQNTEKEISINIHVSSELIPCTFESKLDDPQMCAITIDILPQILFEEVQITVAVLPPIKVHPRAQFFSNISQKSSFTCYAYLFDDSEIPSLNVDVVATVITNLGIPRSISKSGFLPLELAAESGEPKEDSVHKIILGINQTPVPITRLFPEFVVNTTSSHNANAVSFKSISKRGNTVTILQAKSSEKYRVQSDSLASLSVVIEQLIFRLTRHYSNTNDFKVFCVSALPSNELVSYVDGHFRKRRRVEELEENLCQLSSQFRIIQKRLMAKFKMKNPSPLTNLEILLEDTHSDTVDTTGKLESATSELSRAQTNLSCCLKLLVNLIKGMDLNMKLKETLESVFCPSVQDLESQNWENVLDSSLCYLLRTSLAKSEKDKMRMAQANFEEVTDTSKLMKHIVQVLERVSKLGSADKTEEIATEENTKDNMDAERQHLDEKTIEEKPVGNQFGEASIRLLSARKSLLCKRHKN